MSFFLYSSYSFFLPVSRLIGLNLLALVLFVPFLEMLLGWRIMILHGCVMTSNSFSNTIVAWDLLFLRKLLLLLFPGIPLLWPEIFSPFVRFLKFALRLLLEEMSLLRNCQSVVQTMISLGVWIVVLVDFVANLYHIRIYLFGFLNCQALLLGIHLIFQKWSKRCTLSVEYSLEQARRPWS